MSIEKKKKTRLKKVWKVKAKKSSKMVRLKLKKQASKVKKKNIFLGSIW